MRQGLWGTVDRYFGERLACDDEPLRQALAASDAAGLPAIAVSPAQGRLLYLLALMQGARRILEVGTLGGYSTICSPAALGDDGRLVSLELEPRHAQVARRNLEHPGVDDHAGADPRTELRSAPRIKSGAGTQVSRPSISREPGLRPPPGRPVGKQHRSFLRRSRAGGNPAPSG